MWVGGGGGGVGGSYMAEILVNFCWPTFLFELSLMLLCLEYLVE